MLNAALMTVLWIWAVRLRNADFASIGGCLGVSLDVLAELLWSGTPSPLAWSLAVALWLWALRIVWYLGRRMIGKPEDPRYAAVRQVWRARDRLMNAVWFGVFQLQGVLGVVFSLPVFLVCLHPLPQIGEAGTVGILLFALGFVGESLAVIQLARDRASGRCGVYRKGLWAYSRHSNDFFECVLWVGLAVGALEVPYGAVAFLCPVLKLFFLLRRTGTSATETRALQSLGEDYRRYQREVSAFFPWVPRNSSRR